MVLVRLEGEEEEEVSGLKVELVVENELSF